MKFRFSSLFIVLFFVLSNSGIAQEIIYSNDKNESNTSNQTENYINNIESIKPKEEPKINYSLEMGTMFTSNKLYGNSLSFYTAPQINYRLAPKINVYSGIMLINTSISNYYAENQGKNNFNQAYFFSGVDYKVNQKLTLSGEILYGTNKSPVGYNKAKKPDYFVKFSAEYKINENFSIGLQVINQNMGSPLYGSSFGYDPFGNNSLYNPFGR